MASITVLPGATVRAQLLCSTAGRLWTAEERWLVEAAGMLREGVSCSCWWIPAWMMHAAATQNFDFIQNNTSCSFCYLAACLPTGLPQLAVGDSSLRLAFNRLRINGTFTMGTPACPIASSITVTVPGGDETYGVDNAGSYDVHGVMQVGQGWCLNGLSAA